MKRRKILAVVSTMIIVMTAVLGGCGNSQTSDSSSENVEETQESNEVTGTSQTVTLKVWSESSHLPMLERMIESFKQKYAGQATFDITLEPVTEIEAQGAMLEDVHKGADVFAFADDQLNSLVAGGILSEVTDEAVKTANLEAAVNAASVNGKLYAYPMTADNGYFLYYDKNYFSPSDVATLDSILEICAENGKIFSMDLSSGWYFYSFFGNTGLEMHISDDGITNICNWNATEGEHTGLEVAEAMQSFMHHPGARLYGNSDFIAGVNDGSVIAGVSGTWDAVSIKNAWGSDYGACKLPTYTCGDQQVQLSSFKGYKMMGVNYYSENKEWAHKLANWLTNEENQLIRFEEMYVGPSNINAAASEEVKQVPAIAAVVEQAEYGVLQRVGSNYWSPCGDFINALRGREVQRDALQDLLDKMVEGITSR